MGVTGHAETVSVTYDASKLTYGQLLMVFFSVAHDPTQWNRQGPDAGSQYRSAIFYTGEEQETHRAGLHQRSSMRQKSTRRPIVTKVEPFEAFYPAEGYHQDYLRNNPAIPISSTTTFPTGKS